MSDDAIQPTAIVMYSPDEAIQQAKNKSDIVVRLQDEKILKPNLDFGIIPGTGKKAKPTLLKPGAEKLCSAFGLEPRFVEVYAERDYDKEFFAFQYRCELYHIQTGLRIASADGECNSKESKYRWRWLWQNEVDGMDTSEMKTKKTKTGKTQYRIANDDVCSQVNTILKMAQKRALVAAVLIGTNASEHFTQDLEDMRVFGEAVETVATEIVEEAKPVRWNNDPAKFIALCATYELNETEICNALGVDKIAEYQLDKMEALAYVIAYACSYDPKLIGDFDIGFGTKKDKQLVLDNAKRITNEVMKIAKKAEQKPHDPINDEGVDIDEVFPDKTTDAFAGNKDLVADEGDLGNDFGWERDPNRPNDIPL